MIPSSSSTNLSVKNQTCFKRSSRKKTDLALLARKETILRKAKELSILCDIELCLICYERDGELYTFPEDKSKVRDIAERFSKLSVEEKAKKNTNLSKYLKKKLEDEKKQSETNEDNKFLEKVLEMENSLEINRLILQDRLRFLYSQTEIIPKNSQDQTKIIPKISQVQTKSLEVSFDSSTSSNHLRNYPIFLYDDDNDTLTPLANSASSFDQPTIPYDNNNIGYGNFDMLLGKQGFRDCNNIDLPMAIPPPPPMMQTQNTLFPIDQFASWNQNTPSFEQQVMRGCNNIDLHPPVPTQNPFFQFDQFASWDQAQSFEDPIIFS